MQYNNGSLDRVSYFVLVNSVRFIILEKHTWNECFFSGFPCREKEDLKEWWQPCLVGASEWTRRCRRIACADRKGSPCLRLRACCLVLRPDPSSGPPVQVPSALRGADLALRLHPRRHHYVCVGS